MTNAARTARIADSKARAQALVMALRTGCKTTRVHPVRSMPAAGVYAVNQGARAAARKGA